MKHLLVPATLLLLALASICPADDWPRWRGPRLNGISDERGWFAPWPAAGPKVLWRASVGTGFSSFAVSQGRVFTMGNTNGMDSVWCFDAASGRVLWRHSYACPLAPRFYEGGTLATPTVDGDSVYTISKKGHLRRLDAATGRVAWSKNIAEELNIALPEWDLAGSPFIEGDLLVLNVGSAGAALDKHTGNVLWSTGTNTCGYSTPVPFNIDGKRAIAVLSADSVVAVELKTGRELWRHAWHTSRAVNAADPVFAGERFFVSTSDGCALLELRGGKPEIVWKSAKAMRNYFNPSVLLNGHLYGINGTTHRPTTLTCLELATGAVKWSEPGFGSGALMAADGKLILLDKGDLSIIEATSAAYKLLARATILPGKCWTVPVLAHGRLYARNAAGDVVCVELGRTSQETRR
ncbi:MAG: PQQ-like beta-propeller repeat protein [Verrucomicrobiae bacterium]|nr:PQQ-like beta-propeller repeat protein [Verrucomicrobiae bacterium]